MTKADVTNELEQMIKFHQLTIGTKQDARICKLTVQMYYQETVRPMKTYVRRKYKEAGAV